MSRVGIDPARVMDFAAVLDAQAQTADDLAQDIRGALVLADLVDPIANRFAERCDLLEAVGIELRERAGEASGFRAGITSHSADLLAVNLTRGLDSVDTLAELTDRINSWSGSDNDPILDELIRKRKRLAEAEQLSSEHQGTRERAAIRAAIKDALVEDVASQLGVSEAQAEAIIVRELDTPLLLEGGGLYWETVGEVIRNQPGRNAESPPTLDEIAGALNSGTVLFPSQVAMSSTTVMVSVGSLSTEDLAAYVSLIVRQRHLFRIAWSGEEEDYAVAWEARQLLEGYGPEGIDRQRMDFETETFGIDHSGSGGIGIHTMLDIVGMLPVIGEPADGLNGLIYLVEGDLLNAGISGAALLPIGGQAATGTRLGAKVIEAARRVDGVVESTFRYGDEATGYVVRHADGTSSTILELADGTVVYGVKSADEAAALVRRGNDSVTDFADLTNDFRRSMEKPSVSDPKLRDFVDKIYRPGSTVGVGSTADAVRHELANQGARVGGRLHSEKAMNRIRGLQRWLQNNPTASASDRAAAENMIWDMQDALSGGQ